MAVPKRRHSRSRRGHKRAHKTLTPVSLVRCSQCGAATQPHFVCGACGYHRGRQVIAGKSA